MLTRLAIRNIVLIEALDLDFSGGLGVLTGETGAGKSILLDALGLVLGNRADAALVRAGEDRASVAATFEFAPLPAAGATGTDCSAVTTAALVAGLAARLVAGAAAGAAGTTGGALFSAARAAAARASRSAFSACSRSSRALRSSKRALAASAAFFSRSRDQISLLAKRKYCTSGMCEGQT